MAEQGKTGKKMQEDIVIMPCRLTNWEVVKFFLLDIKCSLEKGKIDEQQTGWALEVVYSTIQSQQPADESLHQQFKQNKWKQLSPHCVWYGMATYLHQVSVYKKDEFLYVLLPKIIACAINVEQLQEDLFFSKQQRAGSQTLSRNSVCSLMACFFLCLFPERFRKKSATLNIINFKTFFKYLPLPSQVGKLKCILHYFERVLESVPEGNMEFTRKTLAFDSFLTLEELVLCKKPMCATIIDTSNKLEDTSSIVMHVDFANRSIGGGVLTKGAVQEEIKFCVCPELLVSMLFMENMDDNEAFIISGFEQFSEYRGYAGSFQFAGGFTKGDGPLSLIAIDALSYRGNAVVKQYSQECFMRDFHKALIGFSNLCPSSDAVEDVSWKSTLKTKSADVTEDSSSDDNIVFENETGTSETKTLGGEDLWDKDFGCLQMSSGQCPNMGDSRIQSEEALHTDSGNISHCNKENACHVHSEDNASHVHSEDNASHVHCEDNASHVQSEDNASHVHSEDNASHVHSEDNASHVHSEDNTFHVHSEEDIQVNHSEDCSEEQTETARAESKNHPRSVSPFRREIKAREIKATGDAGSEKGKEEGSVGVEIQDDHILQNFNGARPKRKDQAMSGQKLIQDHGKTAQFKSYNRPIATGNWGCGAYRGNAQLKFILQWLAASVAGCPQLLYFTYQDKRVEEASTIVELLSSQTVGSVAALVKSYCAWVHTYMTSAEKKRKGHWKAWCQQSRSDLDDALPENLFYFLKKALANPHRTVKRTSGRQRRK